MPKIDPIIVGNRIQVVRQSKGLKQHELAHMVDVGFKYISEIERGNKFPSVPLLVSLSDVLEVSTDYLLKGIDFSQTLPSQEVIEMELQVILHTALKNCESEAVSALSAYLSHQKKEP